jgi:hypothetical protein
MRKAQEAANQELAPHRDALRDRHDQDRTRDARRKPDAPRTAAGGAGRPPERLDRNERWRLRGEDAAPAIGGGPGDRFRQFDRNGDGRVTVEEAGNAPWFARLDVNKDEVLTLEELGLPGGPDSPKDGPGGVYRSPTMKRAFAFRRDYTAGTRDANGKMRTGQELMSLRAYRGELFAATSTFTDPRLYIEGDPDYTGCQVLRKVAADAEWQADASFGRRYLRTDYLEVVRFTKDADGKALPEPVEMLIATVWDVGEVVRDSRISGRNRRLTLAARHDATGEWILVPGPAVPDAERGFACIRSLKVHTDKVTGMEYLFIAAGCGGMYKGVYDPAVPGRIRWLDGDELDKSYGRGQSMCVANGDLYVSYDYGGLLVQDQAGGVFQRIDGPAPKWERVYRNWDPKYPTWNQTGRGVTAVPAEDGSGKEVILVGIENPPEPILVRIEPHHGHRAVTELNYNEYFTRVFGRKPQMLGGSAQHPHAGNEIPALNRFDPFLDPETGELDHFVTLFLFHPDDPAEGCNNAYFLVRRAPGEYDWGEVTSDLPAGESLRGVRTIEKSPFHDEPRTYYFGGFFTGPDVQPPRPHLAWIFKGTVGKREPGLVKVASPAPVVAPAAYEHAGGGFSFSYPGDMVRAKAGLIAVADRREAPAIVVGSAATHTVRDAAAQTFREALGSAELTDYTECNLYLGSSTVVAGNLKPGGRVGRRFTCRHAAGRGRPPTSVVGMGWTVGGQTSVIAVSYWGDTTEGMANVLPNRIVVSLRIGLGTAADAGAAAAAAPRGGAAWFGRADGNGDGVLDAAELETLRKAGAAWRGGGLERQ